MVVFNIEFENKKYLHKKIPGYMMQPGIIKKLSTIVKQLKFSKLFF